MPAHPACRSKAVCVNVLKFNIQQPTSYSRAGAQPLVMVLDNHEFNTSRWWPFVAVNTLNFRLGCQFQKAGGRGWGGGGQKMSLVYL